MTEKIGFSGYHLKLIALITMFIDHIAAVVIWRLYVKSFDFPRIFRASEFLSCKIVVWVADNQSLVYSIYDHMRLIGRMAFPIYCFLLVEGFLHTKNVKKYALRLFGFALLSEIPFDMAITGDYLRFDYSNVFFTLLIGLLIIWLVSYVEIFYEFWKEKKWDPFLGNMITYIIGGGLVLVLGLFAEEVLHSDYGFAGVLTILIMYLLRNQREMGFALAVLALTIMTTNTEIAALLMLVPIMKYNGTRGRQTKYLFYLFYPVHLLILAIICIGLGV